MKYFFLIFVFLLAFRGFAHLQECAVPEETGVNMAQLTSVDKAILQAIKDKEIPGAVLSVVYRNKLIYLKAFGDKQIYPWRIPMTENTIFDLASLTKPVSTAISVMILEERGKLLLKDKVNTYIQGFQGDIRIIDLLTHTSGLPSYVSVNTIEKNTGE